MGNLNFNSNLIQNSKISVDKQNLTSLQSSVISNKNFYIFKGGTVNTISTVFNYLDFVGGISPTPADTITLRDTILAGGSVITYFYHSTNNRWQVGVTDATNTIITVNKIIQITAKYAPFDRKFSVNPNAIIQKYYNGSIDLT